MTLKVNVKPLAEKNPIGTLCAAIKWQATVGVVRQKEMFFWEKGVWWSLLLTLKTTEESYVYDTDLGELKRK